MTTIFKYIFPAGRTQGRAKRGVKIRLTFHGGAQEVGRSCIEVETEGKHYLLDAGVKFKEDGLEFPTRVFDTKNIDALFVSHAHLDHSGALPMFEHLDIKCPIYMTRLTFKIAKIMLKDSFKIDRIRHLHAAYTKTDLIKVKKDTKMVKYHTRYHLDKHVHFYFHNAGHIPGSASIKLLAEHKTLLYTGDIKTQTTELMKGADTDYGPVDILITESTYGNTPLPDRNQLAEDFLNKVQKVIDRQGTILIPVFAVGRAQEILILLQKRKWNVPIIFDGLCKMVTHTVTEYPDENINKLEELKRAYNGVTLIKKPEHRKEAALSPGIIVTTSGMMQGGPVMQYMEHMWGNQNNCVMLTGFQCKRTNGRMLFDDHFLYINGWKTVAKCEVQKFDFSGHSDMNEIKGLITKTAPKTLIIQHGDPEQIQALKAWAIKEYPQMKVHAPKVDDVIEL